MEKEQLEHLRHSLAHLLAAAVMELWPDTKRAIGPSIDDGFYFDFEFSTPISETDFPKIEAKMRELMPTWKRFERHELSTQDAKKEYPGNQYKLELIDQFADEGQTLSFYKSGDYWDLCRGGHRDSIADLDPHIFKLTKLAGAYWRGNEKNPMLTRIYAAAFATKEELDAHLTMLDEAKKRDHRKLGKELELFTIIDDIGSGLPLFYPKGAILRRMVEEFISRLQEPRGYTPIWIPHITKGTLYETSGHLQKYDAMYPPMHLEAEADYYLKPMNCPHFMMLYASTPHSYREMPMRWVCTTTNYRYEKSGELSGLTRVRSLTQDDCHVFARPDQIEGEINLMLDMIELTYQAFGFHDFWVRISVSDPENPDKYIGDKQVWIDSEASLKSLIQTRGWRHEVGVGEAAFYGPKLDFMFQDAIGREWQLSTIQLDMNLPKRFELAYVDSDGSKKRPVVIHRAILGSTERFLGILIEHYAGAFPFWMAPVQLRLATVSDDCIPFAKKLLVELVDAGIRAEMDDSNEKVGKKIRNAATMKIPWTIVIGAKEAEGGDYKVNVFGQEEDLVIPAIELLGRAKQEAQFPT